MTPEEKKASQKAYRESPRGKATQAKYRAKQKAARLLKSQTEEVE
jgi:hypothetical protein